MTRQQKATRYGLSAVLLWSTVATVFKLSLRYLTPIELLLFTDPLMENWLSVGCPDV